MVSWFTSLIAVAGAGFSRSPEVACGEHVARLVCSACHVVTRDQEYPPILTELVNLSWREALSGFVC
jgi:hypothetical protein